MYKTNLLIWWTFNFFSNSYRKKHSKVMFSLSVVFVKFFQNKVIQYPVVTWHQSETSNRLSYSCFSHKTFSFQKNFIKNLKIINLMNWILSLCSTYTQTHTYIYINVYLYVLISILIWTYISAAETLILGYLCPKFDPILYLFFGET